LLKGRDDFQQEIALFHRTTFTLICFICPETCAPTST
jgi:hypothetical protein